MSHQKTGRAPIIGVVKEGEKQPPDEEGKYQIQEERQAGEEKPQQKHQDPPSK